MWKVPNYGLSFVLSLFHTFNTGNTYEEPLEWGADEVLSEVNLYHSSKFDPHRRLMLLALCLVTHKLDMNTMEIEGI